jgi:hypothetical protein
LFTKESSCFAHKANGIEQQTKLTGQEHAAGKASLYFGKLAVTRLKFILLAIINLPAQITAILYKVADCDDMKNAIDIEQSLILFENTG